MARLDNDEIAAIFNEMADLTHIVGGNRHRIRSFRRTARVIEGLPENVETMIRFGTFQKTPGIGEGSVRRVKQILRTGTCDDHRALRKRLPPGLRELLEIKGVGASTARRLWQHLKISTVEQLEWAIRTGRIQTLPRMGQRTAEGLLKGIADYRLRIGKVPWVRSRRIGMRIVQGMREMPEVQQVTLAGSLRRGKALIGDLDVLVASDDRALVAARFRTLPEVAEVLIGGEGRSSVRLVNGQQCDMRVLPPENWGAGMHYFTGSKLHNIAVRARGLKVAGLKISDKGVFVRDTEIRVHTAPQEQDVFTAAKLPFIDPALRENTGEIEAAIAGRLPRLITAEDLRGDLHMHTLASDGRGTPLQMVEAALDLGHEYIAITDHTKALDVANGLDERRLLAQVRHLRQLEDRVGRLRIAAGTEVDILPDGSLDLDLDVLRQLDWVVASVHHALDMDGDEMTDRLIAAMETGVVDCVGHPTGRRLGQRSGSDLDMERLLAVARRLGVAVEVNGNPYRMDLHDVGCRRAREMGVPVCLNTDAHAPDHLVRQEFGLITARRGWLEPKDVLNTQPWAVLAERRSDRFRTRGWTVPQRLAQATPEGPQPKAWAHGSCSATESRGSPVAEAELHPE
ncbi:MAG: DNA polymerase/3'-5' exonuclease PolX, partial [Myxococcales bacterium]|nr:DNA polymerase/3'-5' exonuclease PolX [Myxococcales bacterium]